MTLLHPDRFIGKENEKEFLMLADFVQNSMMSWKSGSMEGSEMIDEVLYMEARIFREFCSRFGFSSQRANGIFNAHKIWQYIESCYDLFHTCGDEYILNDIVSVLRREGVAL